VSVSGRHFAYEGRPLHSRVIEIAFDCLDARQAVGWAGQKEVLVVEAEDRAATHSSAQHGHLGRNVLR